MTRKRGTPDLAAPSSKLFFQRMLFDMTSIPYIPWGKLAPSYYTLRQSLDEPLYENPKVT